MRLKLGHSTPVNMGFYINICFQISERSDFETILKNQRLYIALEFLSNLGSLFVVLLLLAGRCYEVKTWAFYSCRDELSHVYLFCKFRRGQILSQF